MALRSEDAYTGLLLAGLLAPETQTAEHVIVRFRWDDDEGDDWIEGEGLLDPLLEARSELATGDLRLLYLGWLLKVQLGGLDEDEEGDLADEVEPPVPAGLREQGPRLPPAECPPGPDQVHSLP